MEVDIRNIKLAIDTEHMQAKSQKMFIKDFSISMVENDPITQLPRQAAQLASLDPRDTSFTGVWS